MIELLATCALRDVRADLPPVSGAARADIEPTTYCNFRCPHCPTVANTNQYDTDRDGFGDPGRETRACAAPGEGQSTSQATPSAPSTRPRSGSGAFACSAWNSAFATAV